MKNKGFTLTEILGVIVVIGLLLLLVSPVIINRIRGNKDKVEDATYNLIYNAASQHINENRENYPEKKDYCISVQTLIDEGKLASPVTNPTTGEKLDGKSVYVNINSNRVEKYEIIDNDSCQQELNKPNIYITVSPAGWAQSKTVKIEYPGEGSDYEYQIEGGEPIKLGDNLTENISIGKDSAYKIEETNVTASMMYNGENITETAKVDKIDFSGPDIRKENSKLIIADNQSGVKKYAIIDAIACPDNYNGTYITTNKDVEEIIDNNKNYCVIAIDNVGNESKKPIPAGEITEKKYTVIFNANGGTGAMTNQSFAYGESKKLNANEFTKEGATFNSWNTKADGSGDSYSNQATVSNLTTVEDGTVNLYAQWKDYKVIIQLHMNNGSLASEHGDAYSANGQYITKNGSKTIHTIKYGGKLGTAGLANYNSKNYVNIVKAGYKAVSGQEWISEDGKKKYDQETQYEASDFCNAKSGDCTVTLKVNWKANNYTVTYNANGGTVSPASKTVTYNSTYGTLATPAWTGHIFKGWYTAKTGGTKITSGTKVTITSDQTIYAHWDAKTIETTFMRNASSSDKTTATQTFTYGITGQKFSKKNWTKTGYTLTGWSQDKNATKATWSVESNVTDGWINKYSPSITIYGVWAPIGVPVSFQANGDIIETRTINYNAKYTFPSNPKHTSGGYNFKGWYTEAGPIGTCQGTEVKTTTTMTKTKAHTLYACWEAKEITVKYQANSKEYDKKVIKYGDNYVLPSPNPEHTSGGYVFNGWYTEAGATGTCSGTEVKSSTKMTKTSNHTIYVCWKDNIKPTKPTITNPCNTKANGIKNCKDSGTVTATSSDAGSGIVKWKYHWGDGKWREKAAGAKTTFWDGSSGTENWAVQACDKAGNCSNATTYTTYVAKYSDCATGSNTCRGGYKGGYDYCPSGYTDIGNGCVKNYYYPTMAKCQASCSGACGYADNGAGSIKPYWCSVPETTGYYHYNGIWYDCATGSNTCKAGWIIP